MWDLDDTERYCKILSFAIPCVLAYGNGDLGNREIIRRHAAPNFPVAHELNQDEWIAFRITAKKRTGTCWDIDNVIKLIVDSFGEQQLCADNSEFPAVNLYPDDNINFVRMIQAYGEIINDGENETIVEIFKRLT